MGEKFSDLITRLVHTWLLWVKNDKIAKSDAYSIHERSQACDACEELIRNEYRIVESLDAFFNTDEQAGH